MFCLLLCSPFSPSLRSVCLRIHSCRTEIESGWVGENRRKVVVLILEESVCERGESSSASMKRSVVHKEDLPAQVNIKRRRTAAVVSSLSASLAQSQPSSVSSIVHNSNAAPAVDGSNEAGDNKERDTHHTDAEAVVAPSGWTNSKESLMEESSDDDMEELEQERRRIEQLRFEKQRTKDEKACGNVASASAAEITGKGKNTDSGAGGISSYNHDVLFRRREWREQGIVDSRDGAKKKKWEAVQNNAQQSAAFQHFMKKHFK